MCNKKRYSFKNLYIITFTITTISFIIFYLYSISRGSIIKYDEQQNTSTILDMLYRSSVCEVSISREAHIESVEYLSDFHNYKLKVKYVENGKLKNVLIRMNDRDSVIRNYFRDNGAPINGSLYSSVMYIYKFIFLTLFLILIIKILVNMKNSDSK